MTKLRKGQGARAGERSFGRGAKRAPFLKKPPVAKSKHSFTKASSYNSPNPDCNRLRRPATFSYLGC